MKAEDNNRMEALAYIIANTKAENAELEQRVNSLLEEKPDKMQFNGFYGRLVKDAERKKK